MTVPIVNRPRQCRAALAATRSAIALDVETCGLGRQDRLVSVGLLIDGIAYVLFVGSRVVPNVSSEDLLFALEPLTTRKDLTIIGHNVQFDIGFLCRHGIKIEGIR